MAGVTRRTLHYYDEIGLLKPGHVSEKGYRWYSEADLLRLQQILLYRETGLPLEKIKEVLNDRQFDSIRALKAHRVELQKQSQRLNDLMGVVDQTLCYLQGETKMRLIDLFKVLNEKEEQANQAEAMRMYDPETVKISAKRWQSYGETEKERIMQEGNAVYEALPKAMPNGAASPEAQAGVAAWRKHMSHFWTPNLDQLVGLADLYNDDPRFKANFDKIDPQLAEFVREAVKIYVETNLSPKEKYF